MSSAVTRGGIEGARPGREAITGADPALHRGGFEERHGRDDARDSYYGQPVIREPVWRELDIAGYLFLGGLAGGSSLLALGAELAGMPDVATRAKATAALSGLVSMAALVHDLGRPERFLNMLRVCKPTSPMNVGSWLLGGYVPVAAVAAGSALTGRSTSLGKAATVVAGALGPAVAAYTSVLIADTAVPAWHDGMDTMPFLFVGSSAAAAGGTALVTAARSYPAPAARYGVIGGIGELVAMERMRRSLGIVGEVYTSARVKPLLQGARALTVAGVVGTMAGRRRGPLRRVAGGCLALGSLATRFGVFRAGVESARDPRYVVEPQRRRAAAVG